MARTDTLPHFLTDVADAIRTKTGSQETIQASSFDTAISNIPSGGDVSEYFTSTIPSGNSNYGGLKDAIKTIPSNMTPQGTSLNYAFSKFRILTTIPLIDTSNVTSMVSMFETCLELQSVPLLDTSKVTDFGNMFSGCTQLSSVPLFNTSSVTNFTNMFSQCRHLSEASLDNILQMCINATSYNGTKTLVQLGISSSYYSSATIQALPHYQDFIDANWTIGY